MNEYYVYQYVDPRNNLPFYIGKGKGARIYYHLTETKDRIENKKKYAYIKGLKNKGLEPIISKIAENLTSEEAYDLEAKLIRYYGRKGIDENGILTNICEDNRPPVTKGPNHHRFGKFVPNDYSIETRKKISAAKKGKPNGQKGKKKSIVTRMRMSEAAKGKKQSDITKEKLSKLNTGDKNPNFGTLWITNGINNSKIKKDDIIPDGWYNGRTLGKYKNAKNQNK